MRQSEYKMLGRDGRPPFLEQFCTRTARSAYRFWTGLVQTICRVYHQLCLQGGHGQQNRRGTRFSSTGALPTALINDAYDGAHLTAARVP